MTIAMPAFAKDGDSGNSGSGNSGSGNSGSGNSGDNDDDSGDDDSDDGDDDNNAGHSNKKDQDKARDAVNSGKAANLAQLMAYLRKNHPGRVLNVNLQQRNKTYVYKVKLLTKGGRIQTLKLNAKTLRRMWL